MKGADHDGGTITYLRARRLGDTAPVFPVTPVEITDPDGGPGAEPPAQHLGSDGHPAVLLLGPMELIGARGPVPSRARSQCIEYCAWLLEHPGSTSTAMMEGLCVAEATRRSNMSRLRRWLGDDADGQPYLPDAYSGRIYLAPTITSDWERVQLLATGGVNRARTSALVAALELVRGAPLADAAPGQWPWAEELRTDMISMLRDIGVELARRARDAGDLEAARWAASRALTAAPGDELLMAERIRVEFAAGRLDELDRLVRQTQFKARSLGVDLLPETVELMQQVLEGGLRARRV